MLSAYAAGTYTGYQNAINSLTPKAAINAPRPINATGLNVGP